jgi:four helix bundle protein
LGYAPEGAKRRYPAHFVSKLTDADGELQETMHWLGRAAACGYLSPSKRQALVLLCQEVGKKLGKMMQKPDSFA